MSPLLAIALADYGLTETLGPVDTPEIMAMAAELGVVYPHDEVAWCGLAMAAWVARAGLLPPRDYLSARSWMKWGSATESPRMADIAIFWRGAPDGWEGHVGLFIRQRDALVYVLGGNQGNSVSVSAYPASRVLGYRRV